MTIAIKPTASGSTIEQNGSTILTVDSSGNIAIANDLTVTGSSPLPSGPAFRAVTSGGQSVSTVTTTKIIFNTEQFDTNSNYDSATNYRFTPTVAGYYQVNLSLGWGSTQVAVSDVFIYKNGASYAQARLWQADDYNIHHTSTLVYLNGSTDYIEGYVRHDAGFVGGGSRTISGDAARTFFDAHLVRAA